MTFTRDWPPPTLTARLDSPPSDLLAAWLPELVERHEALRKALTAERETRLSFESVFPAGSTYARDGVEWTTARQADAAAVKAGRKPGKLAALIGERASRYGLWLATATVAAELVADWNRDAHEEVADQSRARLVDEEANLRGQVAEQAVLAVAAAMESGAVADDARLRAAWKPLSAMDAAGDAWRPVCALLAWVSYTRPVSHGLAWEPLNASAWPTPLDENGRPTLLGQAVALRDSALRARFDKLRPASRAGSW